MRLPVCVVVVCLIMMASSAWADCPLDLGHGTGWVVFSQHYMIAFRPDPPILETGEPLALILNVCTKGGDAAELVGVDVQMVDETQSSGQHDASQPAPLRLHIVPGADGRYRAEGLMLTKPGSWEVTFDVRSGGDIERLTHELEVR